MIIVQLYNILNDNSTTILQLYNINDNSTTIQYIK